MSIEGRTIVRYDGALRWLWLHPPVRRATIYAVLVPLGIPAVCLITAQRRVELGRMELLKRPQCLCGHGGMASAGAGWVRAYAHLRSISKSGFGAVAPLVWLG